MPPPGTIQKLGKDGSVMAFVPEGEFWMGSDEAADEMPRRKVDLPSFWVDKYEVTHEQFAMFMAADGYLTEEYWSEDGWGWLGKHDSNIPNPSDWEDTRFNGDNQPVIGVNWYEADAYCRWAGKRLPTEAEWEKAARWDYEEERSLIYPWGDSEPNGMNVNICDASVDHTDWEAGCTKDVNDGYAWTAPVRSYPDGQSPYGVFNMIGNVWEWTSDWYKSYPGSDTPFDLTGEKRVIRGASWRWFDVDLRAANRYSAPARPGDDLEHVRTTDVGFRCACDHPCMP